MAINDNLHLHEEIMLLALRDKEGTIASGVLYQHAVAAALLAELLMSNHIAMDTSNKKKLIDVVNPTPIGDPLLDECLELVRTKRRTSLQNWVARFAGLKNLKHRVAEQLVRRGILRADENQILLIFTQKKYPELNPEPERRLIERIREAIFTDTEELDPRTVVLVSLGETTGLLRATFDKKELKARKKRITQIVDGEMTGKAAKEAIEAMQAAVMVACIMPAIVTS